MRRTIRAGAAMLALGACLSVLSGCFPLAATGVAVGAMSFTDRRTVGAQAEDQAIEFKAGNRLREAMPDLRGVSVTSFNRKVLLTGQVSDEKLKQDCEAVVAKVDNVRSVHNELQLGFRPSWATSATDTTTSARVKAALFETKDLQANSVKVVTESAVVYLMGLVTAREGERAAQVAARLSGVQRVVTVFEYITDEELARMSGAR